MAPPLINRLARAPLWIVGVRGYSSHALREMIETICLAATLNWLKP